MNSSIILEQWCSEYREPVGNKNLRGSRLLIEYIEPVEALLSKSSTHNTAEGIEDRPIQAVIARNDNKTAVLTLLMNTWFPYRYEVLAVEELNAIAAGQNPYYWNIDGAVENGEFFIIDLSSIDTVRARSGFGEYDDAALVSFLRENREYQGSKVIVILDRRLEMVRRWFPIFCTFAREHGIEVFDKGKYRGIGEKV